MRRQREQVLRIGAETSAAFRSAKDRRFRGANGDRGSLIDSAVLTPGGTMARAGCARARCGNREFPRQSDQSARDETRGMRGVSGNRPLSVTPDRLPDRRRRGKNAGKPSAAHQASLPGVLGAAAPFRSPKTVPQVPERGLACRPGEVDNRCVGWSVRASEKRKSVRLMRRSESRARSGFRTSSLLGFAAFGRGGGAYHGEFATTAVSPRVRGSSVHCERG